MNEQLQSIAELALIGGALGMFGQFVRVLVGLSKALATPGAARLDRFAALRAGVTLLIGGAGGAVGAVAVLDGAGVFDAQTILMLIALGYAGTDVIEGFAGRYLPTGAPPNLNRVTADA